MGKLEGRLDRIDRKILRALYRNARISNQELSDEVGLSPSPCWKRQRALEEGGVILGYTTRLNARALGFGETVLINVSLEHHNDRVLKDFERELAGIPEVLEAYLVTGDFDYLLRVAVSGTDHYEAFLREKLYRIPGVRQSRSSFILRCLKDGSDLIAD